MNLNLLKTFQKVVELGSFTKAAAHLKQPKSRISRAISSLEEHVGVQLIKRTTRSISLTEAGLKLFKETSHSLRDIEDALDQLMHEKSEPKGVISLTAPEDFGHEVLEDLLIDFQKLYPLIEFNLLYTNDYLDLNAQNIDIAFRAGQLGDSSLLSKSIGITKSIFVASPDYLKRRGKPKNVEDLKEHDLLYFISARYEQESSIPYNQRIIMRSNSFPTIKRYCLKSSGIGLIPYFLVKKEIESKKLIRIIPSWTEDSSPFQMLFTDRSKQPKRVQLFMDFIFERVKKALAIED